MGILDGYQFDPQTYSGGNGILGMLAQQFGLPQPGQQPQGFPDQLPQNAAPAIGTMQPQPQPQQAPDQNPLAALFGGISNGISGLFSGGPGAAMAAAPGAGQQSGGPPPPAAAGPGLSLGGAASGLLNHLSAGANSLQGGNPIAALFNGVQGLATGQRNDAVGMRNQQMESTYRALVQGGVPPAVAQAAALNPEVLKTIAPQLYSKPDFGVIGTDQYGNPIHGFINKTTQTTTPANTAGGAAGGGPGVPAGAMDLHGEDFLKTLDPAKAQLVRSTAQGLSPYPTGFVMKTPFGQWLTQAVGQYEPGTDANTFGARGVLRKDLAKSGNSSMGGILANGDSAFKHLAEYGQTAAGLGNASHDFYGGGNLANAQNYIGNTMFPTSQTKGQIGAARDNLMHYGQESTKFYSATGGGEAERLAALRDQNPATASSEETAAYLEKEKSLMMDRFKSKTDHIINVLGETDGQKEIAKYAPSFEKSIKKIDESIAKLRGGQGSQQETQAAAPPKITTQADWSKLQKGTQYTAPDGTVRTKQ